MIRIMPRLCMIGVTKNNSQRLFSFYYGGKKIYSTAVFLNYGGIKYYNTIIGCIILKKNGNYEHIAIFL